MVRTLRWSCVYRRFSCRDSEYVQQGAALHSTVVAAAGRRATPAARKSPFRFAFAIPVSSLILSFACLPGESSEQRGDGGGLEAPGRRVHVLAHVLE